MKTILEIEPEFNCKNCSYVKMHSYKFRENKQEHDGIASKLFQFQFRCAKLGLNIAHNMYYVFGVDLFILKYLYDRRYFKYSYSKCSNFTVVLHVLNKYCSNWVFNLSCTWRQLAEKNSRQGYHRLLLVKSHLALGMQRTKMDWSCVKLYSS